MSENEWDENDLAEEELLRMWQEGEPVAILRTRVEIEPPHMRQPDGATRAGAIVSPGNIRLAPTVTAGLCVRGSVNTEGAGA
jgi:hypothetical protein